MYFFILIWLLIWWKFGNNEKILHLVVAIIPVFVMVAFRAESVGKDTAGYLQAYNFIDSNSSLIKLWEEFDLEKGYVTLCYFLRHMGFSGQSILFSEALIFCYSIIYFCKYCANDKFFILMISVLSLSEFSLSGVRQTFALSIFLIAYRFAQEKRWLIYIILSILAVQFHTSSLLIFPFGILINMKFNKRIIWLYLCILVLSLLFMNVIFNKVSLILDYDEYQLMSLDGGYVSFIISLLFCYVVLISYKFEHNNLKFQQASHYTLLYAMFSAIRFVNVMIMRTLLYLSVFPYLMIDTRQDSHKLKKTKTLAAIFCIVYFIHRLSSLEKYNFFWSHL